MNHPRTTRSLPACLCLLIVCAATRGDTSALWGRAGELWDPTGRLPDVSYAGYHQGEDPLPQVPAVADVTDFGAVPNDDRDDTAAFLQALAVTRPGAVTVPAGRFIITDILTIERSGRVLRGAGPDLTVLHFPRFLNDIRPNWGHTTSGRPTSNYSWSGGFLWLRGSYQSRDLARVTEPASRGDTALTVDRLSDLSVGQRVEIYQHDRQDQSLARTLYAEDPGRTDELGDSTRASQVVAVTGRRGGVLRFDRPLRFDVDPIWQARIRRFAPTVSECGIEQLTLNFDPIPYDGHFTELGHNGVALQDVVDCWVRDLRIENADSGLFASGRFCTLTDITFTSTRKPTGNTVGHHGIYLSDDDNLFRGFDYRCRFIHDITVSHCAGNAIAAGRGVDLCFDHHKRCPYANVFTDIDLGAGTRPWKCGGGADLGKHSAAWETFWNLRAARALSLPPSSFAPDHINLVNVDGLWSAPATRPDLWIEAPAAFWPPDLYEAQRARRLGLSLPRGRR